MATATLSGEHVAETRPPGPLVGTRLAVVLAILGGLALWMAFPPVAFGPYAGLGVGLLTAAVWRGTLRRGLGLGAVTGLVFFGLLLTWMFAIGWDAWLLLVALCASWVALVGAATALVTRLRAAPVWIGAVWVLAESLHGSIPFGGFPWGELAFAQPDTAVGRWAFVGGTALVTFVVALVGSSVVALVVAYRAGARRSAAAWFAAAALVVLVPSALPLSTTGDTVGGPSAAVVAAVQGGTPQTGMGAMDVRRAVLDNHVTQTLLLAEDIDAGLVPEPAFVLWPENSSDLDPFVDATVAADITAAARTVGAPILVGAMVTPPGRPDRVWNVGIVWDPVTGPGDMYVKTHPVPFGEYIPFRDFLAEHIGRFGRVPRDMLAGEEPGNLAIGGVAVGNVICFEIAYQDVVAQVVDGGARLLTVQTNNATYGGTAQPDQQLAITRMRAIEFGRAVVVAATSGISAVVAPDGGVTQSLGQEQVGSLVATVPLRTSLSPAARVGAGVEILLCAVAIAAVVAAAALALSRRRRHVG